MSETATTTPWASRIVATGEVDPADLVANPKNWRIHPQHQQQALTSVLDKVGWVQDVIVNQASGFVLDGHLRVSLAISREEPSIPVSFVELSESEEDLVLAGIDPLSNLAVADPDALNKLLEADVDGELNALFAPEDVGYHEPDLDSDSDTSGATGETESEGESYTLVCPECGHEFTVTITVQ